MSKIKNTFLKPRKVVLACRISNQQGSSKNVNFRIKKKFQEVVRLQRIRILHWGNILHTFIVLMDGHNRDWKHWSFHSLPLH